MKKNVLRISFLIALFALSFATFAQHQVTVSGNITDGDGSFVSNQEVIISARYDTINVVVYTNDAGDYTGDIELAVGDTTFLTVQTYAEECYQLYEEFVYILPTVDEYEADFVFCEENQQNCDIAFFSYADLLTVNFDGFALDTSINFYDWKWYSGDNLIGNEQNITHTYAEAGEYWVTVQATSDECGTISYSEPVYVRENYGDTTFCFADFYYITDSIDINTVSFFDMSWPDEINTWMWDFGDGNTSTEQNPVHTYAEEGQYNVVLMIEMGDCRNFYEEVVWVGDSTWYPNECEALFYAEYNNEDYKTVNFEDLSWGGYGQILAWDWNFGDGNASSEQNPIHTFTEDGEYLVTLTIYSDSCRSTFEEIIYIEDYNWGYCQTMFYPAFLDGLFVKFYDLSTPKPTEYYWIFGDGDTSTVAEPLHEYPTEGEYQVDLFTAVGDCYSAFRMDIYVADGNKGEGSHIIRAYAIPAEDSPLSIENPSNEIETSVSLYPNPVIDELNINISKNVENVTVNIYNVSGQLIKAENFTDNQITVNTQNLSAGVYITKINIDGKISSFKFVK